MYATVEEFIAFAIAAGAPPPADHLRPGTDGWDAWAEPAIKLMAWGSELTAEQRATLIAQCAAANRADPPGCSIADALREAVQPDTLATIAGLVIFGLGFPAGMAGLRFLF